MTHLSRYKRAVWLADAVAHGHAATCCVCSKCVPLVTREGAPSGAEIELPMRRAG